MVVVTSGSIYLDQYCVNYLSGGDVPVCDHYIYVSNYTKEEVKQDLQVVFGFSIAYLLIGYTIIKFIMSLLSFKR